MDNQKLKLIVPVAYVSLSENLIIYAAVYILALTLFGELLWLTQKSHCLYPLHSDLDETSLIPPTNAKLQLKLKPR